MPDSNRYSCEACGAEFDTREDLNAHNESQHEKKAHFAPRQGQSGRPPGHPSQAEGERQSK